MLSDADWCLQSDAIPASRLLTLTLIRVSRVPQLCAVFHNDCFYIAHHLLTLGHQFRGKLPEAMRPAATFVDMVPAFQELGEATFLKMQRLQQLQLSKTLAEARGFGGTDDDDHFEEVQRIIQQVQHQLTRLASVWKVRQLPASSGRPLPTVYRGPCCPVSTPCGGFF